MSGNKSDSISVEAEIAKLKGKKFNTIGRAADMMCLFLGENYSFLTDNEIPVDTAEFSLHVQSHWRFRADGTILLASDDVYEIQSDKADEMNTVFDVKSKQFAAKMDGAVVTECSLSPANDFLLVFSNGVVFEQFCAMSEKAEEWRLIDFDADIHTVCYDEGIISCE